MAHASTSYPVELLLLLEAALVVAIVGLVMGSPRVLRPWARWLGQRWRGLRRRPGRTLAGIAVATVCGMALGDAIQGFPVARVSDEQSYLLAADTFARGRLANPTPELWPHFQAMHVLMRPTYGSKFPPLQGAVLAVGQRLGHPGIGLWLSAGLLVAAVGWMLLAWHPQGWALLGAGMVALRLGVGSYWNESYWGGSVAAVGGALVWGALPRWRRSLRGRDGALLALGAAVLAGSRPYEGLAVALPAAVVGLGVVVRRRRLGVRRLLGALAPGVVVLAAAAAGLGVYTLRTTGELGRMPYQVYEAAYAAAPVFVFGERRAVPADVPADLAAVHEGIALLLRDDVGWPRAALDNLRTRAAATFFFQLGLPLSAAILVALATGLGGGRRRRGWLLVVATVAGLLVAHALTLGDWPHYTAPGTGLLWALAILGLRRARAWLRHHGRREGARLLPWAVAVATLTIFVAQVPAQRTDPGDWSRERRAILAELAARPGDDLVLVRAPAGVPWLANGADLDHAPVLLARELGTASDLRLLARHADREVWIVEPGPRRGGFALRPYDGSAPPDLGGMPPF